VPEPCFHPGPRHQWVVGLSLPNPIRDSILQIPETRDKFLAPVTVPEARSLLSENGLSGFYRVPPAVTRFWTSATCSLEGDELARVKEPNATRASALAA